MANRSGDWLRQPEADLRQARNAANSRDYDWSCFAGHQAAEKTLKAVFPRLGMDAWGHTLTALIGNLPESARPPDELVECCRMLDKHYILTRYPNGFDSGAQRLWVGTAGIGGDFPLDRRPAVGSAACAARQWRSMGVTV